MLTKLFVTTSNIDAKALTNNEAKVIENGLYRQINTSINQLKALALFIQNTPEVTKAEFAEKVSGIHQNTNTVKAMSWNPLINQSEKLLLETMLMSLGKVFQREDISKIINLSKERAVDVVITRLRQKIEPDPKNPIYLQTVRGNGYVLWAD